MIRKEEAKTHLADTGWTYWQHFLHCWLMNLWLFKVIIISTIHGIHPGFLTYAAPKELEKLSAYQRYLVAGRKKSNDTT